jgi:rod shape-determining protein MreC
MESFFARYKNSLVFAFVLLAQFVLIAVQVKPRLPGAHAADQSGVQALRLGVNTVITPPEKVLHNGGLSFRGIWSSYINLINVKQQNEQLQAENQQLQLEQVALAEDARQGQRLQELLAFRQHYVDTTIPAQVVGTSGSDHERILNIDKGSADGVAPEMPVITTDGIVGRIREVTPHSSQILEISDPTSAAGVLLEETRTRGILRGDNVGHTEIVNLMPDDRIKPGQYVLTSGGDQIFPRGLPVGVVDRVVPDIDNQPLVDVILKPAANLNRLEEVLVVTGTSTAPSSRSRRDLAKSETTAAALKAAAAMKAAAAAEAALEAQRASDILAQRLPSASNVFNPDAPDAAPGASPATADSAAAPLHPPSPLHADHYSPGGVPAAQNLTPGERLAPLAQGTPSTERHVKTAEGADEISLPSPSVSPAFRAAHDAAMAARPHAKTPVQSTELPAADAAQIPGTSVATRSADSKPTSTAPTGARIPTTGRTPGATAIPVVRSANSGVPGAGATHPPARAVAAAPARTTAGVAGSAPGSHPAAVAGTSAARPGTPSSMGATPTVSGTPTNVVTDGPLPTRAPPTTSKSPTTPKTVVPRATPGTAPHTPAVPGTAGGARRHVPEVIPDDGSRPPASAPQAPPSAAPPPQEHR